jgi:hypothetical protein
MQRRATVVVVRLSRLLAVVCCELSPKAALSIARPPLDIRQRDCELGIAEGANRDCGHLAKPLEDAKVALWCHAIFSQAGTEKRRGQFRPLAVFIFSDLEEESEWHHRLAAGIEHSRSSMKRFWSGR